MREILSSAVEYLRTQNHRRVANLVELELPVEGGSTKIYHTDYQIDISFQGNTYTQGAIKSISNFTQTSNLTSQQINITMTGLDGLQLGLFLQDGHSLQGKRVKIYQAFLDNDNKIIPFTAENTPIIWFSGILQGGTIQDKRDTSKGESTITWVCTNDFYDFERVAGRFTNDQSHRQLITGPEGTLVPSGAAKRPEYQNDLGFFHSDKSIQILAKYQAKEKRYKVQSSKRGGIQGLLGGRNTDLVEYYQDVEKSVDLSFNLAAKYLPVVYGTQLVGGIPIFADTEADNPNVVWVVYAVCEGEISGFLDIYVDDKPLICIDDQDDESRVCFGRKRVVGDTINKLAVDSSGNPVAGAPGPSIHGQSYILKDDDGEIQFWVYHGLKEQQASSVLVNKAQSNGFFLQQQQGIGPEYWNSDFKLLDTQYVVMRVTITEARNNIPDIMFEVKGRKVNVYDHNYQQRKETSSNLAWQILDYSTSIFGQNIPLDQIDIPSFYDIQQQYDTIDTSYDQMWVPFWRYLNWEDASQNNRKVLQTNWVLDTASSVFDTYSTLLKQGQASLSTFNGKYYLTQQVDRDPVLSIDLDNTQGGSIKITDSTGRNKFNTVGAGISDPANLWNQVQVSFYNQEYLSKDSMQEKKLNLTFPGITNYYTARTMASRELKKSRYQRSIENVQPDSSAMFLLPNDPVTLTYGRYGFQDKTLFVDTITTDSSGRVTLKLTEFERGIFINSPQVDNSNNQIPGISSNVLPPRNLQYFPNIQVGQGQVGLNGTLQWKPSLSTGVLYYSIYQSGKLDPYTVQVTDPQQEHISLPLVNLQEGNYTFEVRQVIGSGLRSKPQVLSVYINPAKSLNPVTNFRALNRVPGEASVFQGGYLELAWDQSPDEQYVSPLYYVIEFYNSTDTLVRSLRVLKLYNFNYLLQDMKQDYKKSNSGQLGVYRKYRIRIRAEGSKGEQSVTWTELS